MNNENIENDMGNNDFDVGKYSYKIYTDKEGYLRLNVFYWPDEVTVEIDGSDLKRKLFENIKVYVDMNRDLSGDLKVYKMFGKRDNLEQLQKELKEMMYNILSETVKYKFSSHHILLSGSVEKSEFIKMLLYSIDTLVK